MEETQTQARRESTQPSREEDDEDDQGRMEEQNVDRREYPQKMIRTDSFPFRTGSAPTASLHHLPPLHPSSQMINVGTNNGPIANFFYNTDGNGGCSSYDSPIYDVGSGALGPRIASFKSQAATGVGMGGALNHRQHQTSYSVFTPLQWQELKRQALIYKHIVSSSTIPPDLLVDTTCCRAGLPSIPPLYPNLGQNGVGGGGYFNLRFTNNTDPEPGRCRRTDGKKWRCAKDVAPDQKYCERHLHRGRPRSRKPVGQQRRKTTTPAADSETTAKDETIGTTSTRNTSHSDAVLLHANIGSTDPIVCGGQTSSGSLPFSSTVPDKEPRYLDWMRGGLEDIQNNNIGLRLPTTTPAAAASSSLPQYEEQLKMNYSSGINDACNSLFLNNDYSSHSDADQEQDQGRYPLRSFIDALSNEKTSAGRNMASTSPSNLTLSMANNTTEESSISNIQMGLGITNNLGCGRSNSLSWMNPISAPLGGPLAEALQSGGTGTATSSPRNSSEEVDGVLSNNRPNNSGRVNLLGWSCCGSPKESPPRMVVSSPTGVLQRTFVSLSDSSSNSSPTFQWMNSHTK